MSDVILFLSPHLDDVILSCPAHVLEAVATGAEVVVATVFSEGGPQHAGRRHDDTLACASLGAHAKHLGMSDAPWRRGHERTFRALVLDLHPADAEDLERVRAVVDAAIEELRPAKLYAPLGVGDHIDHRLLHAAVFAREGAVFFEDQPYASIPGAVPSRLGLAVDPAAYRAALSAAPMMAAWLPEGAERERALDDVLALRHAPLPVRESHALELDAPLIAAARAAQLHYASEITAMHIADLLPVPRERMWARA